jgi:hypothetical protein
MQPMYYIGLDVHKRKISYCVKRSSGQLHAAGSIPATRCDLDHWMNTLPHPWSAAMEATPFTDRIYDHLKPYAVALKVVHPLMLQANRYRETQEQSHQCQQDLRLPAFRDWQENTHSILLGSACCVSQWKSGSPSRETAAERPTRAERRKEFTPALLPSASGEPFVDKDLSCHGSRLIGTEDQLEKMRACARPTESDAKSIRVVYKDGDGVRLASTSRTSS